MIKINAPPIIKEEVLKTTIGIDSIHILIKMNRADLKRFCIDRGFRYKMKSYVGYQRKWFIFLADGEPITATYHFRSRTIKFEIGKLMNYSINQNMHKFTQQLVSFFADREQTVGRVDISVDVNKKRDDLIVKNFSKIISSRRISSTTYHNAKGLVFIAYDKSYDLKIYSTDLTRFELRLTIQLASWKVKDFLSDRKSLDKLVKNVDEYFRNKVEIYSNDRLTVYALETTEVEFVFLDFVAFVHGNAFKYKDHFRVKIAVQKKNEFFEWMKMNRLKTPRAINHFVKGRRAVICEELELDTKTFKKVVNFYKSIPNFKF